MMRTEEMDSMNSVNDQWKDRVSFILDELLKKSDADRKGALPVPLAIKNA